MKNRFTPEDTAMLLIDHQIGTMKLARSGSYEMLMANMRSLAKSAIALGMPLILTSSQEENFQGMLVDDLKEIAPEAYANRIKRPGVIDCWMYEPFKDAVLATGKRKLLMAGVSTDVCITFPAISATEDGFDVQVVIDACGTTSLEAHMTATERMRSNGVTITGTSMCLAEIAADWTTPAGSKVLGVMYEEFMKPLIEG